MQSWGRGREAQSDSRDQPPSEWEGSEVEASSWGVGRESGCLTGPAPENAAAAAAAAAEATAATLRQIQESREQREQASQQLWLE